MEFLQIGAASCGDCLHGIGDCFEIDSLHGMSEQIDVHLTNCDDERRMKKMEIH